MPKSWKRGTKPVRVYYQQPARTPITHSRRFYTKGDVDEFMDHRDLLPSHSFGPPPNVHQAFQPLPQYRFPPPPRQHIQWDYRTPHPREVEYDLVLVPSRWTNMAARAAGPSNQVVVQQTSQAHFGQVLTRSEGIISELSVQNSASPAVELSGPVSSQVFLPSTEIGSDAVLLSVFSPIDLPSPKTHEWVEMA